MSIIGDNTKKESFAIAFILLMIFIIPQSSEQQLHGVISGAIHFSSSERDYWPTEGWRNTTPEQQRMDSSRLNDMIQYIEDENIGINSLVVDYILASDGISDSSGDLLLVPIFAMVVAPAVIAIIYCARMRQNTTEVGRI